MARKKKAMVYHASSKSGSYSKPSPKMVVAKVKKAREAERRVSQDIGELQEQLEQSQWLNSEAIDHFINLYRQNIDLGIPENKRFVSFDAKSGKAPDIIHRAMGMLMADLRPRYIAPNKKTKSEELTAIIEKHLTGAYLWMFRKQKQRVDLQALFWQLLVGKSFIQQTYLPFYWDKNVRSRRDDEKPSPDDDPDTETTKNMRFNERVEGYKGYRGPPFMIESLDPRIVWPLMTPSGPAGFLKRYNVERFEAQDAFQKAGGNIQFHKDPDGKVKAYEYKAGMELPQEEATTNSFDVTYYEYIDDEWIFYVCEDELVHEYHHGGSIVIEMGQGLVTGFKDFALSAVSILYAVRDEIPQFDFLRTLWMNRAYIDVFPQLFAELGPEEDPLTDGENNPIEWKIEPMTIKQVRGRITNAFKDAQAGVDYRALIEEMAADIDLATISGLARGVGGAQQPGYAINQLSQAMRTVWKPIIESRQEQWGSLFEHYLWCIKNVIKEEVTVFAEVPTDTGHRSGEYLSIEPDDIQDFFQILCELKPELPIDTQGNMLTWAKMGAEGWATDEEVSREGFNKPDWQARRRQAERDSMRRMMRPAALEQAILLGNVKVQNEQAAALGLDQLNAPFQQSLQSMRQSAGNTPTGANPGAGQTPANPVLDPAAAGGNGIQPTSGANPNNPTPGPRR